jgi:hypothetical protein
VPTRKGSPKKYPVRWPGKTSDRQVSRARPPLLPLEGRGLLREPMLAPEFERHPLAFDGPHWSPWQVLAWIITRDRKWVEHMASDGQSAQEKWNGIDWSAARNSAPPDAPASFGAALVAMAYEAEAGFITASGRRFYDGRNPGSRRLILRSHWSSEAILTDTILETNPSHKIKWMVVWFDKSFVKRKWQKVSSAINGSKLGPPSETMIRDKLHVLYSQYASGGPKAGEPPPSVVSISKQVQESLKKEGYNASLRQIQKMASDPEFAKYHWPVGKRHPRGCRCGTCKAARANHEQKAAEAQESSP